MVGVALRALRVADAARVSEAARADCRETTPGWRRLLGACNEASIALHKCLIEANDIMRKQYRAASLEHHKERLEHEEKQRRAKESKERESSERL
jgi:hypothetical protein